jgi:hypothetical protein
MLAALRVSGGTEWQGACGNCVISLSASGVTLAQKPVGRNGLDRAAGWCRMARFWSAPAPATLSAATAQFRRAVWRVRRQAAILAA